MARLVAFDKVRFATVAATQAVQFFSLMRARIGRVGNLVSVQVQDRQHGAIGDRIQKLVRMPGRRQRTCFGLSIADDASHDQVRIVKSGSDSAWDSAYPIRRLRGSEPGVSGATWLGSRQEKRTAGIGASSVLVLGDSG